MESNWEQKDNTLTKTFEFYDFKKAIAFINKIADIAEEHNHHPNILLHDYKFVTVTSTTHDEKAITEKDHALANAIDYIS